MTSTPENAPEIDVTQIFLDGRRLTAALRALGPVEPALADVLDHLNLRLYPRDHTAGDHSAYVVLDLHGVSLGAQRRAGGLYLHADTSESDDDLIHFEINGGGEADHPTR
ncbi:hypothetical protein [Couchioplanes caeruleus]|uniref:Uncharacterized protein n=2 Tax=Couchioplanes caeruleus TaxID=56438 RepID=A0A1K0FK74_9ACTN|nr:hypothetical protein [Couchioplanes caeruleus]OJF13136.1 hypothetical protein BG844_16825 [Couchioplanes caeruleus subsp. caeruleus]ROP28110.1 hypothetical protein EDD30_0819 [Couchioplanes caeruleus]